MIVVAEPSDHIPDCSRTVNKIKALFVEIPRAFIIIIIICLYIDEQIEIAAQISARNN